MNRPYRPRTGVDPGRRGRTHRNALQAIYAWQISGGTTQQVIAQFAHEQAHEVADLEYFEDLVRGVLGERAGLDQALAPFLDRGVEEVDAIERGVLAERAGLDAALAPHLDRTVEEVDAIERAVLRLAAYELLHRPDVPYRVVLNEAIEIAKRFGSEHGHTYVNGVLDRASADWRAVEVQAGRNSRG